MNTNLLRKRILTLRILKKQKLNKKYQKLHYFYLKFIRPQSRETFAERCCYEDFA